MKLLLLAPISLLLACSSPRYLYRFTEPPGAAVTNQKPAAMPITSTVPERWESPDVPAVYSADVASVPATPQARIHTAPESRVVKPANPSVDKQPVPAEHLDGDLKRAVIFAVAGGVALIIGGQVFFVAGSLSLLVGLIFGIKWFIRQ